MDQNIYHWYLDSIVDIIIITPSQVLHKTFLNRFYKQFINNYVNNLFKNSSKRHQKPGGIIFQKQLLDIIKSQPHIKSILILYIA